LATVASCPVVDASLPPEPPDESLPVKAPHAALATTEIASDTKSVALRDRARDIELENTTLQRST
jgi:hypothetical protein